jgi:hypothetical protein
MFSFTTLQVSLNLEIPRKKYGSTKLQFENAKARIVSSNTKCHEPNTQISMINLHIYNVQLILTWSTMPKVLF